MRAFVQLWDEITRERYGVQDEKMRRFRYGVQVNSLGLTEAQPENNVQRIVLEMLGVTLSKNARARAVQLPAWNEALGLPRPWDQQWSLRLQQVLAFESDLLEYDDIFDGSHVIAAKVASLVEGAKAEIDRVQAMGGAIAAVESGYMKQALVSAHAARRGRIEAGEEIIVGVNRFDTTEPSPLTANLDDAIMAADPQAEATALKSVADWKAQRDEAAVTAALAALAAEAKTDKNLMHATLAAARAGATTGEWAGTLREVFGEFRAPTGVSGAVGVVEAGAELTAVREKVRATGEELGGRLRLLVGKPGLDGHSNGAEQVAVRARDAGFEVIYQGIRLTPEQIVAAAVAEDVHCVGLSILSGSHMELVPDVLAGLRAGGAGRHPGHRRRDHPRVRRQAPDRAGRRGRLHAEGLRADRHHGWHRRRDPPGQRPRLAMDGRSRVGRMGDLQCAARVFVARHGEADYESELLSDAGGSLSALGREQALALADSLAGQRIAHVYVSTMSRAVQTGEIVAARLGVGVTVRARVAGVLGRVACGTTRATRIRSGRCSTTGSTVAWTRRSRAASPAPRSSTGCAACSRRPPTAIAARPCWSSATAARSVRRSRTSRATWSVASRCPGRWPTAT